MPAADAVLTEEQAEARDAKPAGERTGLTEAPLHARALRETRAHGLARQVGIAVGRGIAIAAVLGIWAYVAGRWVDHQAVSDPVEVFQALVMLVSTGRLWPDLWQTVVEVLSGYAIGAALGAALALLFALAPAAKAVLRPFLLAFYSIPKIALAPLIVMWFGLGTAPKIILAAAFVFFVVFMNAVAGIDSVNPHHVQIVRVMGAGRVAVLRKVVLPTTVPFLITGLRLAIPEALIGAVIGEFIAANRGLGYLINAAASQFNTAVSLAAIVVLLAVVATADLALGLIERHVLRWRPQTLGRSTPRL
ncbi:MAG TPA: ABC transporter permease [Stellaceae bacterium]|nr:ABC transporter permease [Stellaceae bacterium]